MKTIKPDSSWVCPKCGSGELVKAGKTTNQTSKKQRFVCTTCRYRTTMPRLPSNSVPMRHNLPKAKVYIITAAQNATPVHKGFWKSLEYAAEYYDAERVVIPGRYKNPTSQWTQGNDEHEWWCPEVVPYLFDGRMKLNERIVILGDVKIQWAARKPLASMDTLTKNMSGIVGHGNRALRSIATPQHKHPKLMLTTGACTMPNYTDTKQGAIGEFNHCFGALIVEIDGDVFYVRELNADQRGSFIDLNMEFTSEGIGRAKPALSISMGDVHQRFMLPQVIDATFTAKRSMMNFLRPRYLIWHDLLDFHTRNHHHKDDWITGYGKWKADKECVRTEIEEAIRFVNDKTPKNCKSIIVSSNHDRALLRWLKEADFKKDPVNLAFYLEIAAKVAKSAKISQSGIDYIDPFIVYAKKCAAKNVQFLKQGESFVLADVEYGLHGDNGPNGSRGTTQNLSTIGVKVTKGHNHTAEIIDGCYSAGKSTGMLEYEAGGPSSHTNSHVVQYANGKRTIIFIINGRYRLERRPSPKHK
ncbi:MAG: IS1 family transposase [Candidatus Lloydbacteria bacterium]|nr:IS1 family transposase [Candidatus Lloydbacteria bacterium]